MTKPYYKPPTRIDQSEIIPFPSPKKLEENTTWLNQLSRVYEQKPEELDTFNMSISVALEFLDKKTLYKKILTDMELLKQTSPTGYSFAIGRFKKKYQDIFYSDKAEIIRFEREVPHA